MFYKVTLIILIFLICAPILSQPKYSEKYFIDKKKELEKSDKFKEVVVKKTYFKNGKLKKHSLYVKLNNDSIDRYFHVGKCFEFYKNGRIGLFHHVNPQSFIESEISFFYKKNGKLIDIYISKFGGGIKSLIPDTSSLYNFNSKFILIDYIDENVKLVPSPKIDIINGLPTYDLFPETYTSLIFKEGVIKERTNYRYNQMTGIHEPCGISFYYDKEGKEKTRFNYDSLRIHDKYFLSTIYFPIGLYDIQQTQYSGPANIETTEIISKRLEKLKKKKKTKLLKFKKGSYKISNKSYNCYIYSRKSLNDKFNSTYTWLIVKTVKGFKIFSAYDVESFTIDDYIYKSTKFSDKKIFVKEYIGKDL